MIEKGSEVWDLVYSHKIEEKWDFKVAAKNFTNTRFKMVQIDPVYKRINDVLGYEALQEERLYKSYREGVDITASATYKF